MFISSMTRCEMMETMDEARAKRMAEELIGKSVGQWEIIEFLGNGKSALVFKGRRNGAESAVKVFDPELIERFGKDIQLQRIQRELLLKDKYHEHLIQILDGGECSATGHLFVVMSCLQLSTLESQINVIPFQAIRRIISQIASAAQYLESLSLCHRDIKPSNIVITPDYQKSVLLDLGVLRPIGNSDLTDQNARQFIGTLRYSSPEFLMRTEIDSVEGWRAVTFYQLGAVLYDLIVKKPLFAEYSEPYAKLVHAVTSINPRIDVDGAPPDLVHLAQMCLIKDPQTRLKLVRWESFNLNEQASHSIAYAKERVRHRNIVTQSTPDQVSALDQYEARRREQKQKQIFDKIEMIVRLTCAGNDDFPPIEVKVEPTTIFIIFPPSLDHHLSSSLYLTLDINLLDVNTEAIIISYRCALGEQEASLQQILKLEHQPLFLGIYNESLIKEKIEDLLYLTLDAAQQQFLKSTLSDIIPIQLSLELNRR